MKASLPYFFNRLILLTGTVNRNRYYRFANRVETVQNKLLCGYITAGINTIYGKEHNFKSITNYASYSLNVPVIEDWKQIESYVNRIEKGEQKVLTQDEVLSFEETSGSTGFSKLIPYNRSLKKEFQKALQVWMLELHTISPHSFYGKSYWSLSPVLKETRHTSSGIRIGFENDAEYFNSFLRFLLSHTMSINSSVIKIKEHDAFYFQMMKQLLCQRNFSFISVWSPTFFLQMDKFLRENFDRLKADIFLTNPKRCAEINKKAKGDFTWKDIWPDLETISCWTDAQASIWMSRLRQAAGNVAIQPKGLLSTEAVISIPIKNAGDPALAYQSHFFEFRNIDDNAIFLAHQLTQDTCYEIIVTTAGGLYRYATKDVVQVTGFYFQIPLLKFLGRQNRTSDIVGEKVTELQVNKIIDQMIRDDCQCKNLLFLKPKIVEGAGVYILYFEEDIRNEDVPKIITAKFEKMLCENPYYQQALQTGQLEPMQYKIVGKGLKERLVQYYRDKRLIKDGDLKLPVLFLNNELKELIYMM